MFLSPFQNFLLCQCVFSPGHFCKAAIQHLLPYLGHLTNFGPLACVAKGDSVHGLGSVNRPNRHLAVTAVSTQNEQDNPTVALAKLDSEAVLPDPAQVKGHYSASRKTSKMPIHFWLSS